MNGYSFPIHENTMKQITNYHRPAPLPAPPDETMKRDENTIGNKSIKQAHDDPPPPTRRRTRRDDETIPTRRHQQLGHEQATRQRHPPRHHRSRSHIPRPTDGRTFKARRQERADEMGQGERKEKA